MKLKLLLALLLSVSNLASAAFISNDPKQVRMQGFISGPAAQALEYAATRSAYFNKGRTQVLVGDRKTAYDIGNNASWSFWIKPDSAITTLNLPDATVISNAYWPTGFTEQYTGWYVAAGKLDISNATGHHTVTFDTLPAFDTWTHVVITYDGTNARAYHDGVEVDSQALTASAAASVAQGVSVGWVNQAEYQNLWRMMGFLKDVAMFNRALTAGEAAELYNSNTPFDLRTSSVWGDCVGYWPLGLDEDVDDVTAHDLSSEANHLTPNFKMPHVLLNGTTQYLDGGDTVLDGLTEFTILAMAGVGNGVSAACVAAKDDRGSPTKRMFQIQASSNGADHPTYFWDDSTGAYKGVTRTYSNHAFAFEWFNYAAAISGTTVAAQRNLLDQTTDYSGGTFAGIDDTTGKFTVGAMYTAGAGSRFLPGYVSLVAIWNRMLTAEERDAVTASNVGVDPRTVMPSGLIHQWLGPGSTNDLTTSGGIQDQVGSKHLTGLNLTNASLYDVFTSDVP